MTDERFNPKYEAGKIAMALTLMLLFPGLIILFLAFLDTCSPYGL
jgi:hypothetical protein